MGQRRPKALAAKAGGSQRRRGAGDAPAPLSLPPLVRGPPRCFLRCTVGRVLWALPEPPAAALVRLRWWGETSDGTLLQPPAAAEPEQRAAGATARYAVRCGPRQLAAYLTDMGVLVLEVMTRRDHLPIGTVQIAGLSQLSPSHPISGFFAIVSPTSDKLGELQVSLVLEPLPEMYDTSSSIPTTDASLDVAPSTQGSSKPQLLAPSQQSSQRGVTAAGQESLNNSRATTPRGKDHLFFQEDSENIKDIYSASRHHLILPDEHLKANPSNQQASFPTSADPETPARTNMRVLSLHNPTTKDLLSALLDQGNKLRDAMVVSAMKSTPDMEIELNEVLPSIRTDGFKAKTKSPKSLNSNFVSTAEDPHLSSPEVSGQQFDLSSEERAIQLLLGSVDLSPVHLWDKTGSLLDSLSVGNEVYDSELNDPHYDQSLLENLFYTGPKSDSSLSDFFSDDDDVNSSKKVTKTKTLKKADPTKLQSPQKESSACDGEVKETEIKLSCSPTRQLASSEARTKEACLTSLSVDRLALLGRIHLARVIIESLKIPPESTQITPGKKNLIGKPPRPASVKKCTFFVEYHFPMGASKDEKGQVSITTEVIRIASSKITGDAVKFQQRFVFPVHFGGTMIEHWWSSALAFKIYMRKSTQKKPVAVGSAVLQLCKVIQSEQLTVSCEIPVEEEGGQTQVGPLKVSLELAVDNKDFACTSARSAVAVQRVPAHAVRSPRLELQEPERVNVDAASPCSLKFSNPEDSQKTGAANTKVVQLPQAVATSVSRNLMAQITASEQDGLLLHVLLMVPAGKGFVSGEYGFHGSCNVYLNCKLLSTEEATRSAVVWGTTQPAFNFSQVMPFSLTSKHLERLKNNFMIIEAWNKMGNPGCDKLLGLVKLPLHQFYMSFKDPKICRLLLQAQYPVVAVDSYMPVIDVFTGSKSGSLRVILAMGSADQIVALQRLKNEEGMVPPITQRPAHSLDPPPAEPTTQLDREGEELMEHVFEIQVESVKGLTPLQSTVWGEADCYIQYHFPVQEASCGASQGTELHEDGMKLKAFRTATTLCVPDPVFHDEHHHSLLVPANVPVQRLLVSAFMAPGMSGGGIQFEVWCRYYYPNVRDQMVAKGTLPLSRLCAMVTMQHREEIGIQTFNLPLVPRTDSSEKFQLWSSGLLDVSVRYQRSMKTAARAISLSVQIHRAAGLQAAARAVAEKNPSLQYYAGVGVNTYVSVRPSFLPERERRNTRAVAHTFCPEFKDHIEFPCNLIVQRSSGEASSLGELLQSASIIFSIYHQSIKSATDTLATQTSRDYLLGTVTVPTRDLLRRRSGITGWYPVTLSEDLVPSHCTNVMQTIVGGLELSVTFAHHDDRERVLEAAKLLGWNSEENNEDSMDDSDEWEQGENPAIVTISTPRVWLPVHCVLLAGQTHLNKTTYCYLRYKLYNQEATWTLLKRPKLSDDKKNVTANFKKPHRMTLRRSQGLHWFFREEKLEIQVWWAYGKENGVERPLDTDRLIGSAYVDLTALAERSRKTLSVSGVYPLFRCNAADLAGAAVRVHIALSSTSAALTSRLRCAEECSSSEDEATEKAPDGNQQVSENQSQKLDIVNSEVTNGKPSEEDLVSLENTVAVTILVERATHLSLKGSPLTERGVTAPSSYVSFAVADADAPVTTSVVENTDSPVWDFQQQARLSKELLLDPQQTLVFKVWHKAETERVIGFASVDLSPLLSGFQLVCGWYNITDFSGQCRGQIKVAVSPLQSISNLKEERQARIRTQPPSSSVKVSFAALPSNAASFSKQMSNTLSNEVDVPTREQISTPGTHTPRHEEHMQNVRRFHESLQQAEGNAPWAAKMDSSLSSRTALLSALRKNLNELDEVQKYFNQKLTRSFPDFSYGNPSKSSREEQEGDRQGSMSRAVDPKGCHLLEKSSELVSQVSSLISDLQTITKNTKESSNVHQDSSRKLGAVHVPSQKDEEARNEAYQIQLELESPSVCSDAQQPYSLGRSRFEREMLHEFLDQAVPEGERHLPTNRILEDEGAFAIHSHSEDEYEEDVIEPRTLNEITTVTDKTSPWSSVISEAEPSADQQLIDMRPDDQHWVNIDSLRKGNSRRSSTLSSIPEGDNQSVLTTLTPCLSPRAEEGSAWAVTDGFSSLSSGTETTKREFQPPCLSEVHQTADGPVANGTCDWDRTFETKQIEQNEEFHEASKEALGFPGDIALTNSKTMESQEENSEDLDGDHQGEEESGSDEMCVKRVSAQADSEGSSGSFSDESHEDPLEKSVKPKIVLSDPVVLPNFFLPPQELEASIRMLSISSHPSTALKSGSGAALEGIPYRSLNRPRPNLASADLPEEETRRIARIFSARLSMKE
ncbi:C2 domain-containing protein 3 isoform X2 [Dromaius novaehollandiae]|uniref:C2 domain-containing protein 3 isoform X2 n=1 Tax=Dromaius novaehollandiae TaxID=8790 RepID=UPI00311F921A